MEGKIQQIKIGIWIYFLLLIFEGALRKWVLPDFSNQILLIRDPLALFLILSCQYYDIKFFNKYLLYVIAIVVLSFINTLLLGHGNLLVAVYGARIFLLHFPLIFLFGKVLNREMIVSFGKAIMYLAIPMTLLIIIQFFSPQSAWVNRGLGGDLAGAGFSGANGFLRPPGTFSFISGTTSFYGLLGVFVMYFWFEPNKINPLLLWLATICLVISIPFSISRTLFFQVTASLTFSIVAFLFMKKNNLKLIYLFVFISSLFLILNSLNVFSTGLNAFQTRFEKANESEGGIEAVFVDRYLGGLYNAISNSGQQPILGYGLGYGTNVGSMLIFQKRSFTISEGEWGRLIGELGPILGISIILIRVIITLKLAGRSYYFLKRNDLLPWLIFSQVIFVLPQGGWSQPTSLGFCVFASGLLIASVKINPIEKD